MRLIGCHIENFGGLANYDVELGEGLTVIKAKNGFGKTTLASFIKAMFYGMPQKAKKRLRENARKKYLPWEGSAYSGSLVFEVGGKTYRIYRKFGKTKSGDEFKLYDNDTNLESNDYSENIGEELFQLDGESFERSTYLPQLFQADSMSTDSIRAKLGDLVQDTGDVNNFDNAIDALRAKRGKLKAYRGDGGSIDRAEREISRLKKEIDKIEESKGEMQRLKAEFEELLGLEKEKTEKRDAVRERITKASEAEARAAQLRELKGLKDKENELLETKKDLDEKYSKGIPDENSIKEAEENCRRIHELKIERQYIRLGETDALRLNMLSKRFGQDAPDENEIIQMQNQLRKAYRLRQENDGLAVPAEHVKGKKSSIVFKRLAAVAAALTVAAIAVGILLIVGENYAVGGALTAVGAAGFIGLAAVLLFGKRRGSSDKAVGNAKTTLERNNKEIGSIEKNVGEFVKRYFDEDIDFDAALYKLQAEASNYTQLKQRENEMTEKAEGLDREISDIEEKLTDFFGRIFEKEDDKATYNKPGADGPYAGYTYSHIIQTIKRDMERSKETEKGLLEVGEKLREFFKEHGEISSEDGYEKTGESLDELKNFEEELNRDIDKAKNAGFDKQKEINKLQNDIEELSVKADELDRLIAKRDIDEKNRDILDIAMKKLEEAKNSLSTMYLGDLHAYFERYARLLLDEGQGKVYINANLAIEVEKNGARRNIDYFSPGSTDVIMLCMRLALVDAMFKKEEPFLIFDDPFVNLDDKHMERALKLLKEIAKERQIIYLVCNSSRC